MKKSRMIYDRGVAFFFWNASLENENSPHSSFNFPANENTIEWERKQKQQICLQPAVNERNAETGAIFQRAGKILL